MRAFDIVQPRSGLRSAWNLDFQLLRQFSRHRLDGRLTILPEKRGSFFSNLSPNPSAPKNL